MKTDAPSFITDYFSQLSLFSVVILESRERKQGQRENCNKSQPEIKLQTLKFCGMRLNNYAIMDALAGVTSVPSSTCMH